MGMPQEGEFSACYIGISFYREVGGQQLFTSAAQMFDERGRGFILKGRRAQTESRARHPYMIEDDAKALIAEVLNAYKSHHKNFPARVVIRERERQRRQHISSMQSATRSSFVNILQNFSTRWRTIVDLMHFEDAFQR